MDSSRTLILECGAHRVSLSDFSRRAQRLCLHHFATVPLGSNPLPAAEDHWLKNTCAAFLALAASTKIRGSVVVVLPAHLALIKAIKIPRVEPVQREKIIGFEAAQAIPYALTDVVWAHVVVSETETELEVLLATAKLDVLESLCAAAHGAGFEPRVILPAPFASLAGFKYLRGANRESFLGLNLGARSTTLVLVESDCFALRTVALNLDSRAVRPPGDGTVAGESVIARLLQETTRSLLHFQWRSNLGKPGRVYLTGDGTPLAGFSEALHAKLKVPVDAPDLLRAIDLAGNTVVRPAAEYASTFIDLIGAAATQLLPNHPAVNLLPAGVRQQENRRQRRPWLAAAALITLTTLVPPLLHFRQIRDEAYKKSAAIERELAPLRQRASINEKNLQRVEALRQQLGVIESARVRRASWLDFMISLQDRVDQVPDVWLEKVQLAPALADAPLKLMISGRMLDRAHPLAKVSPESFIRVKALLAQLGAPPFVAAVEAEHFDHQQPGMLKFDCVLVLDANHPL